MFFINLTSNLFNLHVPPISPERTSQACGQSQAIARPKGGPSISSVPVYCMRWAESGTSPLLKTSNVCLYGHGEQA